MTPTLLLPIKPAMLYVEETKGGIPASFDFSKLPHPGDDGDENSETPFLARSIADAPFLRPDHLLEKGIHLHWMPPPLFRRSIGLPVLTKEFLKSIVPNTEIQDELWQKIFRLENHVVEHRADALIIIKPFQLWEPGIFNDTRYGDFIKQLKDRLAGHHTDGMVFPAVPNRWLIKRSGKNVDEKDWIVESDFIHNEKPANAHRYTTIPWLSNIPTKSKNIPYRYLGRFYEKGHVSIEKGTYLSELRTPLTALGYGELSFSSYYPNCKSVFGFYDEEIESPEALENLEYQITAYSSNPKLDYWSHLKTYLEYQVEEEFIKFEEDGNEKRKAQNEYLNNWIKEQFQLHVNLDIENLPQQVVCYGHVVEQRRLKSLQEDITITIANSGTEAISATIANEIEIKGKTTDQIEDVLEAILLNDRMDGHVLDVGLKFRELRHEREFYTSQGGTRWVVQSIDSTPSEIKNEGKGNQRNSVVFSEKMSKALSELNLRQSTYDKALEAIKSYEQGVFDYWHHYMQVVYASDQFINTHPNPDDIKNLIQGILINKLQTLKKETGRLNITNGPNGDTRITAASENGNSLAEQLERAYIAMLEAIDTEKNLRLFTIPSARFWIPRDPAFCLSSPSLKGLLHDNRIQDSSNPLYRGWTQQIEEIKKINKSDLDAAIKSYFTFFSDSQKTWNPILLDWQAEFYPVKGEWKPQYGAEHYDAKYLINNYSLIDNDPELALIHKKNEQGELEGLVETVAETLEGRSQLNPFSQREMAERLLEHGRFLTGHETANVEELKRLLTEQKPFRTQLEIIVKSLEVLDSKPRITQSLTGFHQALIGRTNGWQLPIADPIGFDDYQKFADDVNSVIDRPIRSAPLADQSFHPIRSGEISIKRLRLIDSFGQMKDIFTNTSEANNRNIQVQGAEKMRGSQADRVMLPPRFVQGLRLHFRFIDGLDNHNESHEGEHASPVAGWILPEYLENCLLVFDNNGAALGQLSASGWSNTINGQGLNSVDEIKEVALKGFCKYLNNRINFKEANFDQLLQEFKNADGQIEPHTTDDGDFLALLFGQPLAVVNASIGLQLQGNPVTSVTWDECWNRLNNPDQPFSDDGFTNVKVHTRIGEHHQLNDGVLWYWEWQEIDDNDWMPLSVQAPQLQNDDHLEICVNDPLKKIGMLIHPTGKIHATTGVLPVKSIRLPITHIEQVMTSLKGNMYVGPLLTEDSRTNVPLPKLNQHDWKWSMPSSTTELNPWQNGPWRLPQKTVIREGWLTIEEKQNKEN